MRTISINTEIFEFEEDPQWLNGFTLSVALPLAKPGQ